MGYGDEGFGPAVDEASPEQRDLHERERSLALASEAAERESFHRTEAERWERIGRSAMAAVIQLDSAAPVPHRSIDEYADRAQGGAKSLPFQHPHGTEAVTG